MRLGTGAGLRLQRGLLGKAWAGFVLCVTSVPSGNLRPSAHEAAFLF